MTASSTTTTAATSNTKNDTNNKLMKSFLLPAPYTYDHLYSSYAVEWEHRTAAMKSNTNNNNNTKGGNQVHQETEDGQDVEIPSLAWVSNLDGGGRSLTYLVGCTTAGDVVVWDMTTRKEADEDEDDVEKVAPGNDDRPPHQSTTTASTTTAASTIKPTAVLPANPRQRPLIRHKLSNGPLYKVQVVSVVNSPRGERVGPTDEDTATTNTVANHRPLDEVEHHTNQDMINNDDINTSMGAGKHTDKTSNMHVVVAGEEGLWILSLASLLNLVQHNKSDVSSSSSLGGIVQLIQADPVSSSSIVDFDIVEYHPVVNHKDKKDGTMTVVPNRALYVVVNETKLERRRRRRPGPSLSWPSQCLDQYEVTRSMTISQWNLSHMSSGIVEQQSQKPDACFTLPADVLDDQLQEHVTAFKVVNDPSVADEMESGPLMLLLGTSHSRVLVVPIKQVGLTGGIDHPSAVVTPSSVLELPPLVPTDTTISTAPPTNKRRPKKPKRNHQPPTQELNQQEPNMSRLAITSIDTTNGTWWTVGAAALTQLGLSSTTTTPTTSTDPRLGGMVATWHAATRSLVSFCRTRESIQGLLVDGRNSGDGGSAAGIMYTIANEKVITVWKSPYDFQDGQQRRRIWSSAPSNNALALERPVQSSSLPSSKNRLAVSGVGNKVDILVDACCTQTLHVV